jgi:hypothetical protein
MAPRTDEHRVEISENLVEERGKDAEHAVGESTKHWAQYKTQPTSRNDDTCRLSVGKRRPDDECHIEVPSSKAPPVGRGGMGVLLILKERRDSELVVGEREPCSENRYTEMNSTQSRRVPDLKNNSICCSMNKNVSKRWVVPPALPPAVLTRCSPRSQPPTRPKTRFESPYGPQVAVSSIPL